MSNKMNVLNNVLTSGFEEDDIMEPEPSELEDDSKVTIEGFICPRCQTPFDTKAELYNHLKATGAKEMCYIETNTLAEMMNSCGLFVPAYNCNQCSRGQLDVDDVDKVITNDLNLLVKHVETSHYGRDISLRFKSVEMRRAFVKAVNSPRFAEMVAEFVEAENQATGNTADKRLEFEMLSPDPTACFYGCNCDDCSFTTKEPHLLENHVVNDHFQCS